MSPEAVSKLPMATTGFSSARADALFLAVEALADPGAPGPVAPRSVLKPLWLLWQRLRCAARAVAPSRCSTRETSIRRAGEGIRAPAPIPNP